MKLLLLMALALLPLLSPPPGERVFPPICDPAIDLPGEPFSYFSRPTDQLGVMDGENGFMVTCEGHLYTRAAEVVFLVGPDLEPVNQRIRTLRDGRLPIVEYTVGRDGVAYRFTMFAATADGDPRSPLFAFVRIEAENRTAGRAGAKLAVAVRHRGVTPRSRADARFPFRYRARYGFEGGVVRRDGHALLVLPTDPAPKRMATLETEYEGPFPGSDHDVLPETPVCPAVYEVMLKKEGGARRFDFLIPLVPVAGAFPEAAALRGGFDRELSRTRSRWRALFSRAVDLRIPEKKAHDTFWTSLVNVAIARDQVAGDEWVQRVNELQYHTGFWARDASYFAMAWWYAGLPNEGRRVVDHYFRTQAEDGSFPGDPENISTFAMARWFRLTGDLAYAGKAFPALYRSFRWLRRVRAEDPLGLMPPKGAYDNEGISGHYTGHNFYNLCALRETAEMARALGRDEAAAEIEAEHKAYRKTFLDRLAKLVEEYGFIPPGMDTEDRGAQWGNLTGSYPTEVLPPDHPFIEKTSSMLRRELWSEGLMIFNAFGWWSLHHYSTMKQTYSDLLRGRDELVVRDLYAILAHTSATNAGFEFCLRPWSNRDFGGNFSPHGWFAAKLIGLVRLMLVREEGDDLHLLSALPPAWVAPREILVARGLPTRFGRVQLTVSETEEGCRIGLYVPPETAPKRIRLHVPWWAKAAKAIADGKPVPIRGGVVDLAPATRKIELAFTRDPEVRLDYETAVLALKAGYRKRYDEWREREPSAPGFEVFPEKRFATREERKERARELAGREGVAAGRPALASSEAEGHPEKLVTDGAEGPGTGWWAPDAEDPEPHLVVDLGRDLTVRRLRIVAAEGSPPLRVRARLSRDGEEWALVADLAANDQRLCGDAYPCLLPAREARYVRLDFTGGAKDLRISEVRVFDTDAEWRRPDEPAGAAGENLAHGRPVLTSPFEGNHAGEIAVDGRTSFSDGYWAGAHPPPQWLLVDLGETRRVGRARIYFYAGDERGYAFVLQGSADGASFRTLADHRARPVFATREGFAVTFPARTVRYVRLVVTANTANSSAHVAELQVLPPSEEK